MRKNIKRIPKNNKGNRGSLSVETAIMLPVFLLAMLTLAMLIRMVSVSENITHALTDEIGLNAAEGKVSIHAAAFAKDLSARVKDENGSDISSAEVSPFIYRTRYYSVKAGRTYDEIIGASVTSDVSIGFLNIFGVAPKVSSTAVCRAFTGTLENGKKMPFSELEDGGDSNIVWVFPRAGERYHIEDCSVIRNNPKEMLMRPSVRSSYKACELCKPAASADGSLVYVFTGTGKAYHTGSCFIVERFVISMDRKDAKEKGYTACAKCGGGG